MSNGKLKLVEFPQTSLADIPEQLRKLADSIEAGEYENRSECVVVLAGGKGLSVFGYGEATGTVAHYLLCCAQRKIENGLVLNEIL